jgi:hypothetical protein
MWFHIGIRKDGSVSSATYTADSVVDGVRIVYVEADTKELAIAKAKADWKKWRERKLQVAKDRGLCNECFCRPKKDNYLRCQVCLNKRSVKKRETRAIARLPKSEKVISLSERAIDVRLNRQISMEIGSAIGNQVRSTAADDKLDKAGLKPQAYTPGTLLRYVARAYDRDPENFRQWLEDEIEATSGLFKKDNRAQAWS